MNEYSFSMWYNSKKMCDEGLRVLLKKKVEHSVKSGVQMVNGTVAVKGIALNVYSYSVDGALIDTGSRTLAKEFQAFLQSQDIDQIVVSHHHEDHTGNAAYLQQTRRLPILMHPLKIAYCEKKADYPLYRKLYWGKRAPFKAQPLAEQFHSRQARWQVIETPGHAADHVVLLNTETGQLFSGDLYVNEHVKVILRDENLPQLIQSLQTVLTYDFGEMFCSHAGYIQDGRAAIERKLHNMLELQAAILQLHREGYSEAQIHRTLFPKRYPIRWYSFGEWDSSHIVRSFIHDKAT